MRFWKHLETKKRNNFDDNIKIMYLFIIENEIQM